MTHANASSNQSETDGRTSSPSSKKTPRVVSITSKKQAIWVKSLMQRKEPQRKSIGKWMQIVMPRGTVNPIRLKDALEINPEGSYKAPIELMKKYPDGYVEFKGRDPGNVEIATDTPKTQDQLTAEAFSRPATKECILAHLIRLSTHKPLAAAARNGDESDDAQTMYMIGDYTARLLDEKTLEVNLFLACERFIEDDSNDFFPSYAKLLKATRSV